MASMSLYGAGREVDSSSIGWEVCFRTHGDDDRLVLRLALVVEVDSTLSSRLKANNMPRKTYERP